MYHCSFFIEPDFRQPDLGDRLIANRIYFLPHSRTGRLTPDRFSPGTPFANRPSEDAEKGYGFNGVGLIEGRYARG
jgi:hypothetical protein